MERSTKIQAEKDGGTIFLDVSIFRNRRGKGSSLRSIYSMIFYPDYYSAKVASHELC